MSTATMPEPTTAEFEAIMRLTKDLREASRDLPRRHARYLVDTYYQIQHFRIQLGGQIRASGESAEPTGVLAWTMKNMQAMENDLKSCLGHFAAAYHVGQWLQSVCGIGPVISAGLLSEFDVRLAPTAGQFWRFAGLDPSLKWLGKEGARKLVADVCGDAKKVTEAQFLAAADASKRHPENLRKLLKDGKLTRTTLTDALSRRPWSNSLKCLAVFKAGESFVKVQSRENDFYGAYYLRRKAEEIEANENGKFADQAATALKVKKYGKETSSFQCYTEGKLPPAQIHNRARRWAVKLFLSHLHHVMFEDFHGKKPPQPYAFEIGDGEHRHFIEPPNWPGEFGGKPVSTLYDDSQRD